MSGSHEALTARTEEAPLNPETLLPGNIAVVFPGQGSNWVGMGKALKEASPAAAGFFQQADDIVDFPLSQICFEGPPEELAATTTAQLAIATVCVAAYAAVCERYPNFQPLVGGGVSFGELPNLVAAGVIDFPTLLNLVQQRGAIMEEAARENPGRMAAVISVEDRELIDKVCTETGVFPAIWYPGLTIISGLNTNIDAAKLALSARRMAVKETGVLYPFHTPLMAKAEQNLSKVLLDIPFNNPRYKVVINATGEATMSGEAIKNALPQQLTHPVDVPQALTVMRQQGARIFVELCPQPTVATRVKRLLPDVTSVSIHDVQSLQNLSRLLAD